MPGENAPFDESAALAELEDLRLSIERARQRRKQVDAEFDEFVRGFKKPCVEQEVEVAPAPAPPPSSSQDPLLPFPSEIGTAAAAPHPWGLTAAPAASPHSFSEAANLPPGLIPRPLERRRIARPAAALGAAAVVIAAAVLLTRTWRAAPPDASGASAPAAAGTAAPARLPAAAPVAAPSPPPQAKLTAFRRVWVRALVDGNRVLERELQAGEVVPLGAGRTVVIRTGDAGALRLSIDGHDGPLGRDGEVVTRTFNH
jgi:hypothetical protein